jgi:hypothetical protein
MRPALLVLTLAAVALLGSLNAWSKFDCFETLGEGPRCGCIGSEMKSSDSCKSDPQCDKSELAAIVYSCKAARTSQSGL